jgi:GNAT superfamily N-acetyltransferase
MNAARASEVWAAARRDLAMFAVYLEDPHLLLRGPAVLVISGGPTADFNLAMLDISSDDVAMLREFVARVRAAGLSALFMLSSASNARLAAVARAEGLSEAAAAPLMLLTGAMADVTRSDSFSIEHVADPTRLVIVGDLVASAFGLDRAWVGRTFTAASLLKAPGVRFFLATKDGESCSTVMTTVGNGPVGIWNMATAPERQRQGAGRAVLQAAMEHHRAQGSNSFYLIATPAGKPLYDASGFTTVDNLAIWMGGHSDQFAYH